MLGIGGGVVVSPPPRRGTTALRCLYFKLKLKTEACELCPNVTATVWSVKLCSSGHCIPVSFRLTSCLCLLCPSHVQEMSGGKKRLVALRNRFGECSCSPSHEELQSAERERAREFNSSKAQILTHYILAESQKSPIEIFTRSLRPS